MFQNAKNPEISLKKQEILEPNDCNIKDFSSKIIRITKTQNNTNLVIFRNNSQKISFSGIVFILPNQKISKNDQEIVILNDFD